jgi:methylglutaconyl-CoA hydratase
MSNGHVISTFTNSVTTIEFYHPAQNSMPGNLLSDLVDHIQKAGEDHATMMIVLKSAGERSFCAGASFTELAAIEDLDTGKTFFMGFANVINAIRKCPKIVIGRIHGKAVGGGVGLAAACDYCVATKNASIRLSELAVGIGPFVIGPVVERKVGLSAFSQMAINATEWQTADWGKQKGLFTDTFETVEMMDSYIDAFTTELCKKSPAALIQLKKIFWEGTDHWDNLLKERAQISGELILSDFAKDAIKSFLNV